MARRKKTGVLDDLTELVALLPWWAGVGLALIGYLLLHAFASQPVLAATQPGQIGAMVTQTLWRTFAAVGQYVLPIVCLAGAAMSAWKRKERECLIDGATHNASSDALEGMSWQQFEMLVGEGFRRQGYTVAETGGGGADGGVDLVLSRSGRNGAEKFVVQCKQWRAYKVGVDVVRELYGVMAAKGAAGGFVVTSGRFSSEATGFANGRNVKLIDGSRLHALIRPDGSSLTQATERTQAPAQLIRATPSADSVPACPSCAKPMLRRSAKRGANAGGEFWGCAGYPVCRGTRPII